eukprot:6575690-Lingulodinium_polyedra.AAC.1
MVKRAMVEGGWQNTSPGFTLPPRNGQRRAAWRQPRCKGRKGHKVLGMPGAGTRSAATEAEEQTTPPDERHETPVGAANSPNRFK